MVQEKEDGWNDGTRSTQVEELAEVRSTYCSSSLQSTGSKRVRNDLVTKQQQQMLIVINRREGRVHEHGCREVETLWTFSSFCCCGFFFSLVN